MKNNEQQPFIDEEIINNMKELGNGDGDFSDRLLITQLMSVYLENLQERIDELKKAMGENNFQLVERVAHTLKSSSKLIGLSILADNCQLLEDFGYNKNLNSAATVYKKIIEDLDKVKNLIPEKIKLIES